MQRSCARPTVALTRMEIRSPDPPGRGTMLKRSSYVRLAPRLYTQRQPLHRLHDNTTGLPNRPTDEVTNFGSCGYNQRTTQVLTLPRCRETTQSAVFALRLHSQAIRSQPRPVQLPSTAPPFMLFFVDVGPEDIVPILLPMGGPTLRACWCRWNWTSAANAGTRT